MHRRICLVRRDGTPPTGHELGQGNRRCAADQQPAAEVRAQSSGERRLVAGEGAAAATAASPFIMTEQVLKSTCMSGRGTPREVYATCISRFKSMFSSMKLSRHLARAGPSHCPEVPPTTFCARCKSALGTCSLCCHYSVWNCAIWYSPSASRFSTYWQASAKHGHAADIHPRWGQRQQVGWRDAAAAGEVGGQQSVIYLE